MKYYSAIVWMALAVLLAFGQTADAQTKTAEEYNGSAISFNGPRTRTAFFNLKINSLTSDDSAKQYLGILDQSGQQSALDAIRDNDLGTLQFGSEIGRRINVVRESTVEGKRRIFIVFERWTQFAEARSGYRSLDYPFGVVEIFIDERTGKGEGTYIPAARIRLDDNKRTNTQQLEIENFATYPVKLNNITRRNNRRQQ